MKNLLRISTFLCALTSIHAFDVAGNAANSAKTKFSNPTIDGVRLDGCFNFGSQCNEESAESFCQEAGFSGSNTATKATTYGYDTRTIGDNQICDGSLYYCGGYTEINCNNLWNYKKFNGGIVPRYVYEGENIAFLFMQEKTNSIVIDSLIQGFEDVHNFYLQTTGYTPSKARHYYGKLSIAEVVSGQTCGYACGYLTATGIEMTETGWNSTSDGLLYNIEHNNTWPMTLAYEFGRNFIPHAIYATKSAYNGERLPGVITGFAVYMGHNAIEGTGRTLITKHQQVQNNIRAIATMLNNTDKNYDNTIMKENYSIQSGTGTYGHADVIASILFHFQDIYGSKIYQQIWKKWAALSLPINSMDDVANGFVVALSQAAEEDLSATFAQWGWPELSSAYQAELPSSSCTNSAWELGTIYTADDIVSHNGHDWKAKWWTNNNEPAPSQWGVWLDLGSCQ